MARPRRTRFFRGCGGNDSTSQHGDASSSSHWQGAYHCSSLQVSFPRFYARVFFLFDPSSLKTCSAGVGRTGAFILIHALLNFLFHGLTEVHGRQPPLALYSQYSSNRWQDNPESFGRWMQRPPPTLDFVHLVQHMRNQRTCMILRPEQVRNHQRESSKCALNSHVHRLLHVKV